MSNNEQDDKNLNNGKEKQKDTHDLQALNDIGSIIARMHSASSVATLQDIRNSAQNIKSDDPRIQDIIKQAKEVVSRKELVVENQLKSEQMQKALEGLAELEKQIQREKAVIKYKIAAAAQIQRANTTYEAFKQNAEEYKTKCLPLKEMIKVNERGKEYLCEAGINENILLHEEIEERRQRFKALKAQKAEIEQIVEQVNQEKEKLDNLNIELVEKLKDNKLSFKQKQELEKEIKANQEKLEANNNVITEVREIHENIKNKFTEIELIHNKYKEKIDNLEDVIEKSRNTLEPDKHRLLNKKYTLLKDQHEAIVNNKDTDEKDRYVRKEIRSKVRAANVAINIRNNLGDNQKQLNVKVKKGEGGQDTTNKDKNIKKTGWQR